MTLGLYHADAPSEARLESEMQLLDLYQVGGALSVRIRLKMFLKFLLSLTFVSYAVDSVNIYLNLSSKYS